jgi:hypothetical protein
VSPRRGARAVVRAARAAGLACLVGAGLASPRPGVADGPAWAELEVPARVGASA